MLTVIVNVPADDEQVARVPKTGEQEKKRAQAGWQSVCSGTTIGSQHSAVSQESPQTPVVPKPSEQRSSATMRTKAKEVLISQTCKKFWFYTDKMVSAEWRELVLRQRPGDWFRDSRPSLRTLCSAVIKSPYFSARRIDLFWFLRK